MKKFFIKQKSGYRLDDTPEYSNKCERIVLDGIFPYFYFSLINEQSEKEVHNVACAIWMNHFMI